MKDRFLEDGKSIKGVWDGFMKKSNLNRKLVEHEMITKWEELVGRLVSRHTTKINYYQRKLTIYLDSAPLKQEVNSRKEMLIERINVGMNRKLVDEIIIR